MPDAGINATDPEGTAVSFSISCQYLTIDSTSGIVTMTTSYDIETSATNPYTIPCVVMATDATSQTSTATLDVIVSDGNDNAPVFTQITYTFYIYEGTKNPLFVILNNCILPPVPKAYLIEIKKSIFHRNEEKSRSC